MAQVLLVTGGLEGLAGLSVRKFCTKVVLGTFLMLFAGLKKSCPFD